jgi:hypothetical protein
MRQCLRKRAYISVKRTIFHLAMRETQLAMGSRRTQVVLLSVAIILGVAGPFGTEEVMRLLPRIFYWGAVAEVTFASGSFISLLGDRLRPSVRDFEMMFAAGVGLVIGVVIGAEIFAFNWAIFGISPLSAGYAVPLMFNIIVVSVIIRVAIFMAVQSKSAPTEAHDGDAKPDSTATGEPLLTDRLPYQTRGALISLSVNDHYVDVTTTKGTDMLLMRLVDAIREAGDGFQVHRSHWVARDHIASVKRDGAKAVIKTSDGRDIPVSRTYVPVLKEAGFLP